MAREPGHLDTQLTSGNVRSDIISAALDLFSRYGFDSISTTEIAQSVGISQPNIHYYFKTKEDLWKAAVVELRERIRSSTEARTNLALIKTLDSLSALKVMSTLIHKVSCEIPELGKLIFLEGQAGGRRLEWLLEEALVPIYSLYMDIIKTCIAQKKIKPYEPHQILMLLHGAAATYYNLSPLVSAAFETDPRASEARAKFTELYIDTIFSGLQVE